MITIKTAEEINILRICGKKLAIILEELSQLVVVGASTLDIENAARRLVEREGCKSAFLNYKPRGARRAFPAVTCISINEEVVHGIPNEHPKIIKQSDIVTIDCGISFEGLFTDAAVTVIAGKGDARGKRLVSATEKALYAAIKVVRPGIRVGDIGHEIEKVAKREGFGLAEELGGHGIGRSPHEDPFIPNWSEKGKGEILKSGMVIAIEPMLTEGEGKVRILSDGYTFVTVDKGRSAHVEHTIVVTEKGSEILTQK